MRGASLGAAKVFGALEQFLASTLEVSPSRLTGVFGMSIWVLQRKVAFRTGNRRDVESHRDRNRRGPPHGIPIKARVAALFLVSSLLESGQDDDD